MWTAVSRRLIWPLWEWDNRTRVLPALRTLERTQWLSADELRQRQWLRLVALVDEAYRHCRYYRETFDAHGFHPRQLSSLADFDRIPVLTKRIIQDAGDALFHDAYPRGALILAKTGGSTGQALRVYADWNCRDLRNAAAIRSDRWAGWDLGMRRAALWGNPPVAKTAKQKLRAALRDRIVYFDTMNMSDRSMSDFVAVWRRDRPELLFGHAHSLYIWAKWLHRAGIDDLRPRGIVSTSMVLMPSERAVIEQVFDCPVTDRYGCEEVGLIGCECERHDGMHINSDHVYVEFLRDDGSAAAPGEPANLVVTDLVNRGMPLIRYAIEDVAAARAGKCPCGRGLPLMESVVGRTADFLVRPDGSLVAGVSLVERTLTAFGGIDQLQLVQQSTAELVLNVVRGRDYSADTERGLRSEMLAVFGPSVTCRFNYADRLAQQPSWKYRFAICNVPGFAAPGLVPPAAAAETA